MMEAEKVDILDVLIIGAGLSGLTAAYEILKIDPKLSVQVLEAKNRVGGRTMTVDVDIGEGRKEKFDLGGQWVTPSQPDIMEILDELGLQTYQQYITGTKVMQVGKENKIRTYTSDIPSMGSLWGPIELQLFIWKVDRLCKQIPVEDPYQWSEASVYDAMTMETFIRKNLKSQGAVDAIQAACRVTIGADLERVSALFFLAYAAAAGGVMRLLLATENGAQELRVKGGTQQISERLADKIGRNRIHLEEPVTRIVQNEELVTVHTATGKIFQAKHVIVGIPPQFVARIEFTPPLCGKRKTLMENMPMGHLSKFIVTYDRAYWRDDGYSGEIVSNGGDALMSDCSSGPLSVVYDATTDNDVPALVGFIAGKHGIEWQSKTLQERKSAVLLSLSKCFGAWATRPTSYTEKIWSLEEYSGGCPVGFGVPGISFTFHALLKPHGKVHWCGTETSTHWTGYLSGAVQSGRRAACEVMTLRGGYDVSALRKLAERKAGGDMKTQNILSEIIGPVLTVVAAAAAVVTLYYF